MYPEGFFWKSSLMNISTYLFSLPSVLIFRRHTHTESEILFQASEVIGLRSFFQIQKLLEESRVWN